VENIVWSTISGNIVVGRHFADRRQRGNKFGMGMKMMPIVIRRRPSQSEISGYDYGNGNGNGYFQNLTMAAKMAIPEITICIIFTTMPRPIHGK